MTIKYKCAECGVSMKIKDELAGQKGKCPKCKNRFVIPTPEEEIPVDDVPVPQDEDLIGEDEEDDDDDFLDMPMEVTAAPVQTTPAASPANSMGAMAEPARDRKSASETKKVTRISSRPKQKSKKSDGFDPADFLMDENDAPTETTTSPTNSPPPPRPTGRIGGLDEEDIPDGPARPNSSMAEMFRDFVPAGEKKQIGTGIASTSLAADALARREEQKQKSSSEPNPYETTQEEEGTDFVQIGKDIWAQYGLYIGGFLAAFAGIYIFMLTGLSDGSDLPDLYYVEGTVLKGGIAMPGVDVSFAPADAYIPGKEIKNSGGHVRTEEDGSFVVYYNADNRGLPAGPYNVTVTDKMGVPLGKIKQIEIKPQSNVVPLDF